MTLSPTLGLLSTFDDSHSDTLSWVTHTARNTLARVDYVSIRVVHSPGRTYSIGATDPLADRADALQHELGEGPCIDADLGVDITHANDIARDARWRGYGPRAAEMGIRSQTAIELRSADRTIGVLNLYSTELGPLEDGVLDAARALAHDASVMLQMMWAVDDMTTALPAGSDIDNATSIVMRRYQLDADRAFHYLVRASKTGHFKLREVARDLVLQDPATACAGSEGAVAS